MPYDDILIDYFGSSLFLLISTSLHKKLRKGYGFIIVEMSDAISEFGFNSIKDFDPSRFCHDSPLGLGLEIGLII